jgi:mannose/cellobiose epimerase-like protein (N-acyl-D-glucosamine 2-epimerase family)
MHMCEAMLATFEATGEAVYLQRANGIATQLCQAFAARTEGRVWEHYTEDWAPDWEKNRFALLDSEEHMFRPFGFQPGHSFEWAKLLLLLDRHLPQPWLRPAAQLLFDDAVAHAWDRERGGVYYGFDADGRVLDDNKYYWVAAEMVAAAALLAHRAAADGRVADCERYWAWHGKAWAHALEHFVCPTHGGWFPQLAPDNSRRCPHSVGREAELGGRLVKAYPSKTDYHPLAACYEALREAGRSPLGTVRAAVWDLDGTLIDFESASLEAITELVRGEQGEQAGAWTLGEHRTLVGRKTCDCTH